MIQDDKGNYIASYKDPGYTIRKAKGNPRAVAVKMFTVITKEEVIWEKQNDKRRSK